MSRSVVTFPTPQEVVPEYSRALEREGLSYNTLRYWTQGSDPEYQRALPKQKHPHLPMSRGTGLWDSSVEKLPKKHLPFTVAWMFGIPPGPEGTSLSIPSPQMEAETTGQGSGRKGLRPLKVIVKQATEWD